MQQDSIVTQQKCWIMYQSIPSLTILPLGDPRGFACSHCTRGRVFTELSLARGSGFWIGEICYNSERNMQELLDLIQKSWRQLEKQVFLCCFILIFAKTVDVYCIFNNIDHLRPFQSFLIKFSGHSRVIFADARSSLKFWVSLHCKVYH